MIGSSAPQRALQRLEQLDRAVVRLGTAELPAALVDDSLSAFAGRPLDESLLEAVLERLGERAADARQPVRPAVRVPRREPAPLPLRKALPWPAAAAPAPRTAGAVAAPPFTAPERASTRPRPAGHAVTASAEAADALRTAAGDAVAAAAWSRPGAGEPVAGGDRAPPETGEAVAEAAGGSRSTAEGARSPFADAAARVPGGTEAIATPVAANWVRDAEPTIVLPLEPGEPSSGVHEAFRRALAAATPPERRDARDEPPTDSRGRRSPLPGAAPAVGLPAWDEPGAPQRAARPVPPRDRRDPDGPHRDGPDRDGPDRDDAVRLQPAGELSPALKPRRSPRPEVAPVDRKAWDEPTAPQRAARSEPVDSARRPPGRRPADTPLPRSTPAGAGGLAELVRRWEQGRSIDDDEELPEWFDDPEAPGTPLDPADPADPWDVPDSDPLDPYEGDDALASALDRLLAGELRRHGIDLESA